MSDINRLRTRPRPESDARRVALYARPAADDDAGTACRGQVREALDLIGDAAEAVVYPMRGGLGWTPTGRRGVRRAVVHDLARFARNATLLETVLGELRAAGVDLMAVEEAKRNA